VRIKGVTMKRCRRQLAVALLALVAAVAVVLAGCGSSGGGGGAGNTPKKGGTLRVSFQTESAGLDPAIAYDLESCTIEWTMFDTLLKWSSGPGEAGSKLIPDLATEVPSVQNGGISADGKTYTFHMRAGVKFAPPVNRELTAADWKYSFERMIAAPQAWGSYFFEGIVGDLAYYNHKAEDISGIKVLDPQTIEIDLIKPDPTLLYKIALPATFVVDKAWVEKWGKNVNHHPLGTGPFMFSKWVPGQEIDFVRNPNYWDASKVWLDGIDFKFGATPTAAVLKLERGDIDVLGDGLPPGEQVRVAKDPNWKNNIASAPQVAWYYVFMNVREKPFDNIKVRQAVNYAINTAKLQKLLAGQGKALNQIFPEGMPGYQANAQFYTYDPTKAKQLLAEAGFPNGFKTTFWTHNVDPFPKISQSIQYDLSQVGIKADIKQLEQGTYWTAIANQNEHVPIGMNDWWMDYPDPSDWIGPNFTKTSALTNGSYNASWWWDPQCEALWQQSNTEMDPAKRIQLFVEMQQIIMEQAPVVPLYQPMLTTMFSKTTGGVYVHPVWQFMFADYWKSQ